MARWPGGGAALIVGIVLGLAGCGANASISATSSSSAASSPVTTATSTSLATAGTSSSPATAGTSTSSSRTRSAHRQTPKRHHDGGAPVAPAGLAPTMGYGTYELCQGVCTGSVPPSLRRPLQLPADDGGPCPVTLRTSGPVFPSTGTQVGMGSFTGSPWLGTRVTWAANASYTGPILIRGGEIGGTGALGFGSGSRPYDELQLLDAGRQAPPVVNGGRAWLSYTRVRSSGCYAYQVDGTSFSEVIVFRAIA